MHSLSGHTPHLIFEIAAYFIAARVYWFCARAETLKPSTIDRFCMLAGALFGAAVGSKALHILEHLPTLISQADMSLWLGGKSVLGGFIGGTVGVEITKKLLAWKPSTGDAWVPALTVGLIIGRVGCQLSGTWDLTYGIPTNLPWTWDYGDHIGRHPTALYEILLVAILGLTVWRNAYLKKASGARFAAFLLGYCAIRFALEFLKPPYGAGARDALPVASYAGLKAEQRFFINYAQSWRQNVREAELRRRLLTDSHSPAQYRVLGPLGNLPEFQQAFGCKAGDRMVRAAGDQVNVW